MRRTPQFYNTLISNCTTIIFELARHIEPGLPIDYRLLLSGHFAEYAYEQGALTRGYDYPQLRALGRINDRAMQADDLDSAGFSQAIRVGVPGMAGRNSIGAAYRNILMPAQPWKCKWTRERFTFMRTGDTVTH